MLRIHRAERSDRLATALAEVLAEPLDDPFVGEVVSVPTRGIERWLAQRLAHRLGTGAQGDDGVCAHVDFPPPGTLVARVLAAASGAEPDTDPWEPARAVWPLLEVIDECAGQQWCAALGAHLFGAGGHGDADQGRRWSTARHLAGLFDSYGAHRPQMLRAWQADRDVDGAGGPIPDDLAWQPELWRRLRARLDVPSPAERLEAACAALREHPELVDLPPRLSVFGPTRLPADHLAVLAALAAQREVHLWLPHPSPELWRRATPLLPGTLPPRHADPTADLARHPLLSSLGRDARELQLALVATGADTADEHHEMPDRAGTLLGRLQRDLRDDRTPAGRAGDTGDRPVLDPDDRSVAVHACHGPDRQVEVLREVVLGRLAADPSLEPRDILVMCPDIETFAPLISASFGLGADGTTPTHPAHRMQVRLADRALRQVNPLLDTVAGLLELADARASASQVLDLLASPPVRRRFRLDGDDLDRLRDLVARSGVRWGLDAAHRAPFELARVAQNTWSCGLDRLLVGVAMSEDEQHWLDTALPVDDVDSGTVDLVGRLAEFVDRLDGVLAALSGPQPLHGWVAALTGGLDALTAVAEPETWQQTQARAELAAVAADAGRHAGEVALSLADIRGVLGERLRGRPTRANFRTGTLTVATLMPMRSVPHRVVCLLGLDDGVFPRAGAVDGDDVLARDPCVADRDPRSEDRQLLLDAVLAATEHLVVVHSGADERTNADRPPAVPIGELLDTVDDTVATGDGAPASEHIVVRHPLQPSDPRNFTPNALHGPDAFSFDRAGLAGARAAGGARHDPPPLLPAPLPPAPQDTVALDELARFLVHPVRGFLRQRVGISLDSSDDETADELPVEPDGLAKWAIGDRLLAARLAGDSPQRCHAAEWRRGELPPGPLGRRVLDEVADEVESLVRASAGLRDGPAQARDVAAPTGAGHTVLGTVGGVHGEQLVTVVYSRLGPKHQLRAWVALLALTVTEPDRAWQAAVIGRGRSSGCVRSTLGPLPAPRARELLADLVGLRAQGLREPLPVPARTAHAYARCRIQGGESAEAHDQAAKEWAKGDFSDNTDPEHEMVYGPGAALDAVLGDDPDRFDELAMRVWAPLLQAETWERV